MKPEPVLHSLVILLASQITNTAAGVIAQLDQRQDLHGLEGLCDEAGNLRDLAVAQKAFDAARPDKFIASMVWNNQRENWLGRLEKLIANDDRTSRDGSSGCSSLTDTCDPGPGLQCHEFYAKGADEGSEIGEMYYDAAWKQAYWVFKAVKGAHKKIIAMKQNLDDGVDIAGLNVKAILNDFGVSPDDLKDGSDVTGGLAAALSIGAAFAGLGGTKGAALGAGLSVGSTILGQLKQDDTFSTADIESSLAEAFKTWKDDLSDVLRIALGGGKDNAEFESLPDLSDEKHRDHESHIGRFFATPFWLLDTDADEIQSLGKNAEAGIQLKLIDLAL